jgi:hypothetical protein
VKTKRAPPSGRWPEELKRKETRVIYVVEIKGRGVAAIGNKSVAEEEYFKEDLLALTSQGTALWDGESELFIRDAFPEEQEQWRTSQVRAIREGELEEDDAGDWVYFLVPVDPEGGVEDDLSEGDED